MATQETATRQYRVARKRYKLLRPISVGPIATVWRARDTVTSADVVVKRLENGSVHDPVARRRLEDEAAVASRVQHPNAVPVLDTMFGQDEAAVVFPFVPGRTLAVRMREAEKLSAREAAQICLDLTDVLAVAHASGVVHRDVKPSNILLSDDGRTRLIDFGISHDVQAESTIEMTGSGFTVGTLPYMAPEQLTGGTPTTASDIYALGVVLYEMLAGQRPYEGTSPTQQLQLQQSPPTLLDQRTAPCALASLAYTALDPVPEQRPTAEQLGRSLRAWLDGRSETDAATTYVPVVFAQPTRRHHRRLGGAPALAAGALALGMFIVLAFAAMWVGRQDAGNGAVPSVAPPVTSPAPSNPAPPGGVLAGDGETGQVKSHPGPKEPADHGNHGRNNKHGR